jgi:hypothetical protein
VRPALVLVLLASLPLVACGRAEPGEAGGAPGGGPVGVWTLDRDALLDAVRRRHGKEGGEERAREEAQARLLELDAELRADGRYGMRTRSLDGLAESCVGLWSIEGRVLTFRPKIIDGKDVTAAEGAAEKVEQARFEDDRILLPFDAVGLVFPLKRK